MLRNNLNNLISNIKISNVMLFTKKLKIKRRLFDKNTLRIYVNDLNMIIDLPYMKDFINANTNITSFIYIDMIIICILNYQDKIDDVKKYIDLTTPDEQLAFLIALSMAYNEQDVGLSDFVNDYMFLDKKSIVNGNGVTFKYNRNIPEFLLQTQSEFRLQQLSNNMYGGIQYE